MLHAKRFGLKKVCLGNNLVCPDCFPNEIYSALQNWVEKAYPKLIHFNRLPKGTHFAAWEQPEYFAEEMRASFKSLRN